MTALGAAVGLEREYRQKPAGLRTNILIAIGSALFTILSLEMTRGVGDHTADLKVRTIREWKTL